MMIHFQEDPDQGTGNMGLTGFRIAMGQWLLCASGSPHHPLFFNWRVVDL